MVTAFRQSKGPFGLVVTGEANAWRPALEKLVRPEWLQTLVVHDGQQLMDVVRSGQADAAVLDEDADFDLDVLSVLRMIRRMNEMLPVVVITRHTDRRWLENALRLTVFSVVAKPLELEQLLRQIHRMMARMDQMMRGPEQE